MSLFFDNSYKIKNNNDFVLFGTNKKIVNFSINDILYVKYYDQYKYLHNIEGRCIQKRFTKNNRDIFVTVYVKTKNLYFSFFLNSPLIITILRKK